VKLLLWVAVPGHGNTASAKFANGGGWAVGRGRRRRKSSLGRKAPARTGAWCCLKGQGKHKLNGSEDASPSRAVGTRKRKGGLVEAVRREREKYFVQKLKEIVAHRKRSLEQAARRGVPLRLLLGRTKPIVADDAPTKVEINYAMVLAELYHSTAKERSIAVGLLMELEGLQPSRHKSGAHTKTPEEKRAFDIVNGVKEELPEFQRGFKILQELRRKYPGEPTRWKKELLSRKFEQRPVKELMEPRTTALSACCRYVGRTQKYVRDKPIKGKAVYNYWNRSH